MQIIDLPARADIPLKVESCPVSENERGSSEYLGKDWRGRLDSLGLLARMLTILVLFN